MIQISATNDFETIARLNEAIHSLHVELHPEVFKPYNREAMIVAFREMMQQPNYYAFLLKDAEKPIGFLLAVLKEQPETAFQLPRKIFYIDQVFVEEGYRGRGWGKALLEYALEFAKTLHPNSIQIDHWYKNERAGKAFQSVGFQYIFQKMELSSSRI